MVQLEHQKFKGADDKTALIDLQIPESWNKQIVLFIHGYKGFKDWGCWSKVQQYFVEQGFGFCKYNVSHNGIGLTDPTSFSDLEGFRFNSYSKERVDQHRAMAWVNEQTKCNKRFFVIGHSRGGGIAILNHQLPGVSAIATWAAISSIENRFPTGEALEAWKTTGNRIVRNGRTNQDMPHDYSQYTDYQQNKSQLDIAHAAKNMTIPVLHVHGAEDTSVLPSEGEKLAKWTNTELTIIDQAQHTFNSKHPWPAEEMPAELMKVCKLTVDFFQQNQ